MRKLIDVIGFLALFLATLSWGSFAFLSQAGCGGNTSVDFGDPDSVVLEDPSGSSGDSTTDSSTDDSTDSTDDTTDDTGVTTSEDALITVEIFGSVDTDSVTQPDEFTALFDCLGQDTADSTVDYIEATCGDDANAITQQYYCSLGIGYLENGGNDEELFETTEMSCTVDQDGVYTITEDELVVS